MLGALRLSSGHSDVVGGIVVCARQRQDLAEAMAYLSNAIGPIMSPFNSFLVLMSLKTLPLSMQRHCQNAQHVAEFLEEHREIERVYYSGLESHPQHPLAARQMAEFGAMISLVVRGGPGVCKVITRANPALCCGRKSQWCRESN